MFTKLNLEVVKAASKEKSRYAINNVLVTPAATIATDGHMLVSVGAVQSSIDTPFTPFQIAGDAIRNMLSSMNGGSVTASDAGLHCETKIGPVDLAPVKDPSQYPNYEAILSTLPTPAMTIEFDPGLLIRALELFGKDCKRVKLSIADAKTAMKIEDFTADRQREVLAVVMPMSPTKPAGATE